MHRSQKMHLLCVDPGSIVHRSQKWDLYILEQLRFVFFFFLLHEQGRIVASAQSTATVSEAAISLFLPLLLVLLSPIRVLRDGAGGDLARQLDPFWVPREVEDDSLVPGVDGCDLNVQS